MAQIRPKSSWPAKNSERWYGCVLCGDMWTEDSDATGTTNEYQGYGIPYAESETVLYEGKRYCKAHFAAKRKLEMLDEAKIDTSAENERGEEIDFGN